MIIFVRHPETDLNDRGVVRGQLDPPPNAKGFKQIKQTAAQFVDVKVDRIYTDDFKRTRAMSAAITQVTKAPIVITPGLNTWDLGTLQGKPVKDVLDIVKNYMIKTPAKAVPGGESFEEFAKRFIKFMAPFYRKDSNVVMVTHGRPIMTAKAWQEADADHDMWGLAGQDLSPEPTYVDPSGIAIMSANQIFKVLEF